MPTDSETPLVNWVQVAGGALAAVSSAVLLSTVGVAGTLVGAAVGSVVASVASAAYTRGLERSRERMAAQAATLRRVAPSRRPPRTTAAVPQESVEDHRAEVSAEQLPEGPTRAERAQLVFDHLPWKRVLVLAVALFVAGMAVISGFELVTGRALSEVTGGTSGDRGSTVPGLIGHRDKKSPTPSPSTGTPTTPTSAPTSGTTAPTEETTPTEATTTATLEETPSETVAPSPTDDPGGSATVVPTP